jgi:hypothetical protein
MRAMFDSLFHAHQLLARSERKPPDLAKALGNPPAAIGLSRRGFLLPVRTAPSLPIIRPVYSSAWPRITAPSAMERASCEARKRSPAPTVRAAGSLRMWPAQRAEDVAPKRSICTASVSSARAVDYARRNPCTLNPAPPNVLQDNRGRFSQAASSLSCSCRPSPHATAR